MKFISHARTLEELRAEFLGDIRRRIEAADRFAALRNAGAEEKARVARAVLELTDLMTYWNEIELAASTSKKAKVPDAPK